MSLVLLGALILTQPATENAPPEHIQKYLRRCDEAKAAAIEAKAREIKALESVRDDTSDMRKQLQAARAEFKRLQEQPAPLAQLSLPPEKDGVGVFAPVDRRLGRSVDVLEVVDEDTVILRAWYWTTTPLPQNPTAAEDATFVDLWVHGMDTSRLAAGSPAELRQVFHVTGNKLFDTACGKRSLPLLEPIDLAPYVKAQQRVQTGKKTDDRKIDDRKTNRIPDPSSSCP